MVKIMLPRVKKEITPIVLDTASDVLATIKENPAMQQDIFTVGAVLGKGIRYGFGDIMGGKGAGKLKMEDIVGMGIQAILPGVLGKLGGQVGSTIAENMADQNEQPPQQQIQPRRNTW
jgi:hypothetical protein